MTGSALAKVLKRIHDAVLDHAYIITPHALEEMKADGLNPIDVESALLTGTIQQVFEDHPGERRYEVVGKAVIW